MIRFELSRDKGIRKKIDGTVKALSSLSIGHFTMINDKYDFQNVTEIPGSE
jgi:hypothetical protein